MADRLAPAGLIAAGSTAALGALVWEQLARVAAVVSPALRAGPSAAGLGVADRLLFLGVALCLIGLVWLLASERAHASSLVLSADASVDPEQSRSRALDRELDAILRGASARNAALADDLRWARPTRAERNAA